MPRRRGERGPEGEGEGEPQTRPMPLAELSDYRAYKYTGGRVYLGNMGGSWNSSPTANQFLNAWHCWFLPYGFNHCAVYV